MNVEEMVRQELEVALSTVPTGSPSGVDSVQRRGGRRLVVARTGLVLAGVVVFAGVFGVSLLLGPNADRPQATLPMGEVDGTVLIAGDRIPVGDLVEAFSEGPMYYGVTPAQPTFDTSPFGEEIPLGFGQATVADPGALEGPTIYVGEIRGQSIFMNGRTIEGVATKCLWIGPTSQLCSDSGAFELFQTPLPAPPVAAWLSVPKGTSVVVLKQGDASLGWQSPVSGVAIVPVPGDGTYQLVALDQNGIEINQIAVTFSSETSAPAPNPNDPTTTTTTIPSQSVIYAGPPGGFLDRVLVQPFDHPASG